MADTRPHITLTAGVYTDVYAALNAQSGFPAVTTGDQLSTQNVGSAPVFLTTKATKPTSTDGSSKLFPSDNRFNNEVGSAGEWAISQLIDGLINVKVL